MDRLAKTLTAAMLVAAAFSSPAIGDPYAASGQKFQYGPYDGDNEPGAAPGTSSQYQYNPQPPADTRGASPAPDEDQSAGPVYRGEGEQDRDPYADEGGDRADGPPDDDGAPSPHDEQEPPPPPRAAEGPPVRDFGNGGLPRVEVQAAAPDDGVPYSVREHDARRAAIEGWRGKVSARFGPEFSHWRAAVGKRVECHPDRRDGIVCIASAQPVRGFARNSGWRRDDRY